jgi:hypothetical protein
MTRASGSLAILAIPAVLAACSRSAPPPVLVDPVAAAADSAALDSVALLAPAGWAHAGGIPETYRIGVDSSVSHGGGASAFIESVVPPPRGSWGAMLQQVDATRYAGERVRVSAFVMRRGSGACDAFVRVDGPADSQAVVLRFTGTDQKRLRCGRGWTEFAFVVDVPMEAERIVYAFGLRSPGRMWVDDVGVVMVDSTVATDRQPSGLPRVAAATTGDPWEPLVIGGKEKPDSTARPTNLSFEK